MALSMVVNTIFLLCGRYRQSVIQLEPLLTVLT
jgi:hypothetical protein